MRTFEHFPKESKCPLCKTNKDLACFLVPIEGTREGNNEQAQPIHVECFMNAEFRMARLQYGENLIYTSTRFP